MPKGTAIYYISGLGRRASVGTVYFDGQAITAESTPVYDGWGPNWLSGYWMCGEWMEWHRQLELKYGRAEANAIWYAAWMQQGALSGPQNCKWDNNFTSYLTNVGLLNQNEWAMILPNVVDAAGNAAGAVSSISSLIKPVAIVALIGAGFWAYKNYLK